MNDPASDTAAGQAQYQFTNASESDITVWALVNLPNKGANSFWYRLDGIDATSTWNKYSDITTSGWEWRVVAIYSSVATGDYTFELQWRETGAAIDAIYLTTDGSNP